MARLRRSRVWLALASALGASAPAPAQIVTDGTLGAVQAFNGLNTIIPAGLGRQAGANLFHSFGTFNVRTGGSAIFAGPGAGAPQVSNVISRVTGAQFSSIDGRLGSSIPGANLFLINPAGILFGPNASLNLTGSFFASTAHYLKLADGTRFEATATANPVLTSAPPAAFGFLGPTGPIVVEGSVLQTAPGRALSLVGGPIAIADAFLGTVAGDLRAVGAAGAGEVSLAGVPTQGMPLAPVSIERSTLAAESAPPAFAPGRIVIRGGELAVVDATVISVNDSAAAASPVELSGTDNVWISGSQLAAVAQAGGRGADLVVRGSDVTVDRAAVAQTWSIAPGAAGDVDLAAGGMLRLATARTDPAYTEVGSQAFGSGAGGAVRLSGDRVNIGTVTVRSQTHANGPGGPIEITGRNVELVDGAYVAAGSAPGSTAPGGAVMIRAAERFLAAGQDWDGFPVYVVTATEGRGAGGAMRIDARDVVVSGAFLDSVTQGAGNGGALTIAAEAIRVESGGGYVGSVGSLSGAAATGAAGPVTLRASRSITLDGTGFNWLSGAFGPTQVLSQNVGPGAGGTVLLESPLVVLDRGAWVMAQGYGTGDVGSVVIRPHDLVLRGGATIGSSRATDATGRSGGVRIEGTGRLTLGSPAPPGTTMAPTDGDSIITSDAGPGPAGDITINMAEVHLGLGTAITSLAAGTGDSGNIAINAQRMRATAALINSSTQPTSTAPGATTRPSRAGSITLNLSESLEMSMLVRAGNGVTGGVTSVSNGSGAAGDISISAPSIVLDEVVVQAAVSGAGRGGRIAVRANDLIMRNGAQLVTGTEATASGAAGSIDLAVAGRLEISGQRRLDGVDAGLSATTRGTGAGGDITIAAGQLAIGGRGFISSSTEGPGNAGSIAIRASTIDLAEGAAIRARSTGPGTAGAIRIAATDALRIFGGSTISTEALSSDGGNIDIRVGNLVHLKRGEITTAVGSGQGAGGNIFIDPTFVILEDGSRIVANAFGGSGGNIRIIAIYFLNTLDTLVDASSQLGLPGTVSIAAPNNNLSTQIRVLPATFFDASQLVREACSSRYASGRGGSSLVGVGRGGLAASPERSATSTYFGDAAAAVASASNGAGFKLTATKQARLQGDCAS